MSNALDVSSYLKSFIVETVCVAARVTPSLPKPERPQRQGVRRESVENSLAAAAAKLSNMPVSCAVVCHTRTLIRCGKVR